MIFLSGPRLHGVAIAREASAIAAARHALATFCLDIHRSARAAGFSALSSSNNNNTVTGFTAGGGLEYLFNPSRSVKAEYFFFDYTNLNGGPLFAEFNNFRFFNRDLQVNACKAGVNYHFRQEYVPLN